MNEQATILMEVIFNVVYLVIIWSLVLKMFLQREMVPAKNKKLARILIWMFGLLAFGDTGHVGFRVVAYLMEGTTTHSSLVGVGKLATSITVTFFYLLLINVWEIRYERNRNTFTHLLFAFGLLRLGSLILPGNQWLSPVTPYYWGLYRNLPLTILGLGTAGMILKDALASKDRPFIWVAIMIFLSYIFYIPVILLVNQIPMIGLLMIPKTLAYLAVAFIIYKTVFTPKFTRHIPGASDQSA